MEEFEGTQLLKPADPGSKFVYPRKDGSAYYQPCEDLSNTIKRIVADVDLKKKIYVRFIAGEREGSIAFIKKILDHGCRKSMRSGLFSTDREIWPEYSFTLDAQLGWDDRKNVAKVKFFDHYASYQLELLLDYNGPTVWKNSDLKNEAAIALKNDPPADMRGRIIKENDKVVFINSRYGSGAELDYGVVNEIKSKASFNYKRECQIDITVIVHSLQHTDRSGDNDMVSKLKHPSRSVLVVNDNDIVEDMLLAKLGN